MSIHTIHEKAIIVHNDELLDIWKKLKQDPYDEQVRLQYFQKSVMVLNSFVSFCMGFDLGTHNLSSTLMDELIKLYNNPTEEIEGLTEAQWLKVLSYPRCASGIDLVSDEVRGFDIASARHKTYNAEVYDIFTGEQL